MKAVKGKVLKKIKAIGYLKPERILPLAMIQEVPETIDSTEPMKDLDGQDKENIRPPDTESPSFRRPDLNSTTLFDPNLLAAFEQAVSEVKSRCPPGGLESIVLYTTGIRGIRETFEDCQKIRSLLENLKVVFLERDISMHSAFKEELWRILGGKVVPPRLFIKGRYIGGAQEVLGMHEQGKLKPLMKGIPLVQNNQEPCQGCVGFRFVVCFDCNGSRRILDGQCSECNENGVIVCPFCCS